jgi:hypothetical protein
MPLKLPATAISSLRNSFAELRVPSTHTSCTPSSEQVAIPSNQELTTTAATMRWAAAQVNLAPLALPSPEHELTDPMRGVTASIPRAHNDVYSSTEPAPLGATRKTRLSSFWEGTQDVEVIHQESLSTIDGSPSESMQETPASTDSDRSRYVRPFPASAPLVHNAEESMGDYFTGSGPVPDKTEHRLQEDSLIIRRSASTLVEETTSVPVRPRRAPLVRQISSPLPESTKRKYSPSRGASDMKAPPRTSRAAKEEQMFAELGHLAPPDPPDEWDRRRALSK